MDALCREYKDRVDFYLVYVREAHPEDGRQVPVNRKDGVIVYTPKTLAERAKAASSCVKGMKLNMACLLDTLDDKVQLLYRGWPARACLVDAQCRIAFISRASPNGVNPPEIAAALKRLLPDATPAQSTK